MTPMPMPPPPLAVGCGDPYCPGHLESQLPSQRPQLVRQLRRLRVHAPGLRVAGTHRRLAHRDGGAVPGPWVHLGHAAPAAVALDATGVRPLQSRRLLQQPVSGGARWRERIRRGLLRRLPAKRSIPAARLRRGFPSMSHNAGGLGLRTTCGCRAPPLCSWRTTPAPAACPTCARPPLPAEATLVLLRLAVRVS